MPKQLKLRDLIIPEYYAAHTAIWSGEYNEYLGDGGRGSLKSTFAATEVVLLVMRTPNIHAVVLRKVGNTIATSVWPEYNRVIDRMGIRHLWKQTKKPYTLTYIPTGQTIQFYGLDDPGKLKSIAVPFGYFGVMHFEEFDQFDGPEEIRNVEQSVFRGGPFSFSFKTFNSPAMARHWVNRYKREPKPKQFRHHTTYLTTPPDWLGPRFFDDAQTLKQRDPIAYAHEYLGEVVGCGQQVFTNITLRPITRGEIAGFDRRYYGLDFGWYPDPNHFGGLSYDHARQTVYIFEEHRAQRETDAALAQVLQPHLRDDIVGDSAANRSIATLHDLGFRGLRGCHKYAANGGTSVTDGMKWLQSRAEIVIDPVRCPWTAREFSEYEYAIDKKTGEVMPGYVDAANHSIDMARYALEDVWQSRYISPAATAPPPTMPPWAAVSPASTCWVVRQTSTSRVCRWLPSPPTLRPCCPPGAASGATRRTQSTPPARPAGCISIPGRIRAGGGGETMASCLISNAPYAAWLSDVLATLEEHKVTKIAVAAPLPGGEVFTGYYDMSTMDKALAAANIQADATMDVVCANGLRIQQAWDAAQDEDAPEEEGG